MSIVYNEYAPSAQSSGSSVETADMGREDGEEMKTGMHTAGREDGGLVLAKAFGAGADFVMAGGMFAGHTESGGVLVERDGKKFKQFYGMSSTTAGRQSARMQKLGVGR